LWNRNPITVKGATLKGKKSGVPAPNRKGY
jgi:hypothetical protein